MNDAVASTPVLSRTQMYWYSDDGLREMHATLAWSNGEQIVKGLSWKAAAVRFKIIKRMPSTTSTTVVVHIALSRLIHTSCLLQPTHALEHTLFSPQSFVVCLLQSCGITDGVLDGTAGSKPLPLPEADVGADKPKPLLLSLFMPVPAVAVVVRQ